MTLQITADRPGAQDRSPSAYREQVAAGLAAGRRFAGLHVGAAADRVHALLACPAGSTQLVTVDVRSGEVPSLVDLVPAAGWDEREAADRFGVRFGGHEPLRPLLDHRDETAWTVPVLGDDVHQVAVGPIHAGVIESGHFRFHLVGDRILHLDARLFYKHRGLEAAAEGRTLAEGVAYAGRACAACAVANTVAYAHACEDALGLVPVPELARVRTVLLELERLWSHLNDVSALCAGVGLAAGNTRFATLTERARALNATLTGHRFLFGTVRVGRSDLAVAGDRVAAARDEVARLREEFRSSWRGLLFSTSFMDRLPDVGVVDGARARLLGTTGPAARAAGLAEDARTADPRLAYGAFRAVVPDRARGDVQARFEQRALELEQTFGLLAHLLDGPLEPAVAEPGAPGSPIGAGLVESPRGRTSCVVERDGDRIARWRLRTGSYANWPSVAEAAAGNLLPDFPLINKSFELCYACADR